MSSPQNKVSSNHSHSNGEDENSRDEDDVRSVENVISLLNANKITKSNVWNIELIDKLGSLVKNHNAFIRNFRNVGMSLDATVKVYEIRVDSVCNDVRRLVYGVANSVPERESSNRSKGKDGPAEQHVDELDYHPPKRRKKIHRYQNNIASDSNQLNARKITMPLPRDLLFKLNTISGDTAASNRLFSTVLATKCSILQLDNDEVFFDGTEAAPVRLKDDFDYETTEYFVLPFTPCFDEHLPIRQSGTGLSGYRVQNTPFSGDFFDLLGSYSSTSEEESNIEPEYAFDVDANDSFGQNRPTASTVFTDCNGNLSFDFNNNDEQNENHEDSSNRFQKGEYSYHAFNKIKNFWAGPSYWKVPRNRQTTQNNTETVEKKSKRNSKKKTHEKPIFVVGDGDGDGDDDSSSDDESLIKVDSRAAKKIRKVNYKLWNPEKLKLPPQSNIPKDFFDTYQFAPWNRTFQEPADALRSDEQENTPDDDVIPMDLDDNENIHGPFASPTEDAYAENHQSPGLFISQTVEDPPQIVEEIPINFDKRAKIVNMKRMNEVTAWSIDRQRETEQGSSSNISNGIALFSKVYKDLESNKRKYMDRRSELKPGLALFSVL